mgnify:CR=1 FL=1
MELKECPFCGQGTAALYRSTGRRGVFLYVKCEFCGAQAKTYSTKLDYDDPEIWESSAANLAVRSWNMRGGESHA